MKNLLLTLSMIFLTVSSLAVADSRLLTCTNKAGSIVFEICGVRGCPATVAVNGKVSKYNLKRIKANDGSLSYSARVGSKACNISISALRQGLRKLTAISCASKLKESTCKFLIPGETSSSSISSSGSSDSISSSSNSSSSSSKSSEDDKGSRSSSRNS